MDFKDHVKQIAERVDKLKDSLQTEEATKKRSDNAIYSGDGL